MTSKMKLLILKTVIKKRCKENIQLKETAANLQHKTILERATNNTKIVPK